MSLFEKKEKEPEPAYIMGKPLKCTFCGYERFWQRKAQLHTELLTFFNLEWTNKSAICFVCDHCGLIQWFLPRNEE